MTVTLFGDMFADEYNSNRCSASFTHKHATYIHILFTYIRCCNICNDACKEAMSFYFDNNNNNSKTNKANERKINNYTYKIKTKDEKDELISDET